MSLLNKLIVLFAFYSTSIYIVFCQNYNESISKFKNEYSVYLKHSEKTLITLENNIPKIENFVEIEKQILTDRVNSLADEYLFHNSFIEISDIKANMYIPTGKKSFKTIPVKDIQQQNFFSSNAFFDDGKVDRLIFSNSPKNSKVVISYKEKYNYNDHYGKYLFPNEIPTIFSSYSVSFPEQIKIRYKLYNTTKYNIQFSETKKKDIITYTWTCYMLDGYSKDYKDFTILYYEPHLLLGIESVNGTDKLLNYEDLYKTYIKLLGNPYSEKHSLLKPIVDSICAKSNSDIEKLEAIYYYVQEKIQYLAFEDGLVGFIPDSPENVFKKKYGDCKGKANLLIAMLRLADIPAYITWVGSRNKPYKYSEFPSLFTDDHMIATVIINNNYYILDATNQFLHYTYPSSFIQGKECLVGLDSASSIIYEIPNVSNDRTLMMDKATLKLDNDTIICVGNIQLTGYEKFSLTESLRKLTKFKQREIYKSYICKNYDNAILDTAYSINLENRQDTLKILYKYKIPNYIRFYDNHIFVNLNIAKQYNSDYIDTSKFLYNKNLDYSVINKCEYKLIIPKDYKVESVPKPHKLNFDDFGFEIFYSFNDEDVILTKNIFTSLPYVEKSKFQQWNQMIDELITNYNETVSLKKK